MSDIRDHHFPPTLSERLRNTATKAALESSAPHSYLPKTEKEAEDFAPHAWVRDAMARAYAMGKSDGAEDARKAIRSAIGAAKW